MEFFTPWHFLISYVAFSTTFNIFHKLIEFFLSGEKIEKEMIYWSEGSSVKGSSMQTWTSGPKVEGNYYFQEGPTYNLGGGGSVNDAIPDIMQKLSTFKRELAIRKPAN